VAELFYNAGNSTVAVVTKPFFFEGRHRMRLAMEGLNKLRPVVDSLLVVPNQNLFQVANESTTFIDSFKLADDILLAGVKGITDLMINPGMINLDFAHVQSVMHLMGSPKICGMFYFNEMNFRPLLSILKFQNKFILSCLKKIGTDCANGGNKVTRDIMVAIITL